MRPIAQDRMRKGANAACKRWCGRGRDHAAAGAERAACARRLREVACAQQGCGFIAGNQVPGQESRPRRCPQVAPPPPEYPLLLALPPLRAPVAASLEQPWCIVV